VILANMVNQDPVVTTARLVCPVHLACPVKRVKRELSASMESMVAMACQDCLETKVNSVNPCPDPVANLDFKFVISYERNKHTLFRAKTVNQECLDCQDHRAFEETHIRLTCFDIHLAKTDSTEPPACLDYQAEQVNLVAMVYPASQDRMEYRANPATEASLACLVKKE
jgi:hypothetical protein